MSSFPDQPAPQHPSLAELRRRYPGWTIEGPAALHVYTAELRSHGGWSLHFLAGHDVPELAARLETATAAPSAPPAMAVPSCPECMAPLSEIAWLGGCPPAGDDNWRCTRCGHTWLTPPAGSSGN